LAVKALERTGLRVFLADGSAQGMEMFFAHRGDLAAIIVDMTMPGMSGREVLRAIRAEDPALPLIAMSGYSDFNLEKEAAELHLAGFVAKPFRSTDLADAVAGVVRARH
jgi:DNA-binding NtrC family response regulator